MALRIKKSEHLFRRSEKNVPGGRTLSQRVPEK
jgi:hypothetical protein